MKNMTIKNAVTGIAVAAALYGYAADVTIDVGQYIPGTTTISNQTLTAADVAGLGDGDNLVKTGRGRLIVNAGLFSSSWTGALIAREGFVRISHVDALGPAGAQGLVVEDGATGEFDGAALNKADMTCPKVTFEGTGADGESALRVVNGTWEHTTMNWTLSNHATWGGPSTQSEKFGDASSKLDMNGKTLTLRGNGVANQRYWWPNNADMIVDPGDIVVDNGLYFITESPKFPGGDSHTLTFRSSCQWRLANQDRQYLTWRIRIESGVSLGLSCTSWVSPKWPSTGTRGWSGPIEIAANGYLNYGPSSHPSQNPNSLIAFTLSGPISGAGMVRCSNNYLILNNPESTIAKIENQGGHLFVTNSVMGALNALTNGTFTISSGALETSVDVAAAELDEYGGMVALAARNVTAGLPGRLALNGLADGDIAIDRKLPMPAARYFVGKPYPEVDTLTVGAGGSLVYGDGAAEPDGTALVVGYNGTNDTVVSRGIVRLEAGGAITNRVASLDTLPLSASYSKYSQGSFIINGGDYRVNDGTYGYVCVGRQIGGFLQMLGGTWRSNGWKCIGHDKNGVGTAEILGGNFSHESAVGVGSYGGSGQLYIGGDARAWFSRLDTGFGAWASQDVGAGAYGTVTVDGNANVTVDNQKFGASCDSMSIINLNGGSTTMPINLLNGFVITNQTQVQSNQSNPYSISNNPVYLNFNGGSIVFSGGGFTQSEHACPVSKITVYKGGVNIRNSSGGTFVRGIKAPTGKGISDIPCPDLAAWEFTGAPLVKIEGDGHGASAFAQFDSNIGKVTNIVVTSPGCDYTWAKAVLLRGGRTGDTEISLNDHLVDNDTSGGVRWFGGGNTVRIAGGDQASTYRGPTIVSTNTTVEYWSASWHYPTNSPLVLEGGRCRLGSGGFTGSFANMSKLTGLSGHGNLEVGSLGTSELGFDAAAFMNGLTLTAEMKSGLFTIKPNAVITIDNAQLLEGHEDDRYLLAETTGYNMILNSGATVDTKGVFDDDSEWRVYVHNSKQLWLSHVKYGLCITIK